MRATTAIATGRRQRGFTLVEMILTVVIISILTAIAAPSFTDVIERQRSKNAAADIYVALTRARSEALRLNKNVTLSPNSGDWAQGWQILDPVTGAVLESHEAVRNLTVSGPASVVYRSSGRTTGTATATFTISGSYATSTRYVCLDLSGRPSLGTTSSC
jgi:type IV fimbrial biogenesis protein FimT